MVDEAAAIPLPLVKKLMGPYLLFLSSTINGYEGTGRALSLKLIQQLRETQSKGSSFKSVSMGGGQEAGGEAGGDSTGVVRNAKVADKLMGEGRGGGGEVSAGGRLLRELKLEVPIRYSSGDKVEGWLHKLLCLDATEHTPVLKGGCPHPSECDLYYVERDTLFSHHKAAEDFLQAPPSQHRPPNPPSRGLPRASMHAAPFPFPFPFQSPCPWPVNGNGLQENGRGRNAVRGRGKRESEERVEASALTGAREQGMMSLYVSSHYKNSPNDLQLLSDAPAHQARCAHATQSSSVQSPLVPMFPVSPVSAAAAPTTCCVS